MDGNFEQIILKISYIKSWRSLNIYNIGRVVKSNKVSVVAVFGGPVLWSCPVALSLCDVGVLTKTNAGDTQIMHNLNPLQ